MNVSKLALSLLIPDLGKLGHVHLRRFYLSDWKEKREERESVSNTAELLGIKRVGRLLCNNLF